LVMNIPPSVSGLASDAGAVGGTNLPPDAAHVRIDYGAAGWCGTCPPAGDKPHRYVFTVDALKVDKLEIQAHATTALAGFMVHANKKGAEGSQTEGAASAQPGQRGSVASRCLANRN
jgi:phosphatidylethanolamine-binding protein (PEBP) family uncharacterized protein